MRSFSLASVADYIPPIAELLRDELVEQDLITPTLPSLKQICERLPSSGNSALQKVVHGFCSSAVETVNNMRARPAPLADRLTKGNLLAITVLVSSLPSTITLSRALLEEYCYLISHKLAKDDDDGSSGVSVTASTCARSMLLASGGGQQGGQASAAIRYCAGQLMAALVANVAGRSTGLQKVKNPQDPHLQIVQEEIKALVGLFATLPASTREWKRAGEVCSC